MKISWKIATCELATPIIGYSNWYIRIQKKNRSFTISMLILIRPEVDAELSLFSATSIFLSRITR